MRGVLESILEMGEEGLWNKKDEKKTIDFFFPAVFYTSGWPVTFLIWSWDEPHIRTVTSSPEIYYNSTYWHIPGVQSPNTRSWLPSRNPMANPCQSRWMLGDKNMSVNSLLAFILHEKGGGVVPVIVGSERGRYCIAITPQQLVLDWLVVPFLFGLLNEIIWALLVYVQCQVL